MLRLLFGFQVSSLTSYLHIVVLFIFLLFIVASIDIVARKTAMSYLRLLSLLTVIIIGGGYSSALVKWGRP